MAVTYEAIATQTLSSAASSATFSSIPSTYTDLVLIVNATQTTTGQATLMRYNSDSGSNYSTTSIFGSGSTAGSSRNTSATGTYVGYEETSTIFATIINIQNYANATTYKTSIIRKNQADSYVEAIIGLWSSTAAINSVTLYTGSGNFGSGSTFTLYGITAA
jgi:hypothetical protein